jgi:hypothetical protein
MLPLAPRLPLQSTFPIWQAMSGRIASLEAQRFILGVCPCGGFRRAGRERASSARLRKHRQASKRERVYAFEG